ncbi:MAG: GAF domain-containing protein [bacterium]|nr:GAF domain-containing protein [bacterium]
MTDHQPGTLSGAIERCLLAPVRETRPGWSIGVTRLVDGAHAPLSTVGTGNPFVEDPGDEIQLSAPIRFEGTTLGRVYALVGEAVAPEDQTVLQDVAQKVAPLLAGPSGVLSAACLETCHTLGQAFPTFDWVGVYRLATNEDLLLTCQLGSPTPHVRIPVSAGICGAAVREGGTLNIPDVKADERFIACSTRTRSEVVVPVRLPDGQIVAEIDVDSDTPAAFGPAEVHAVEAAARELGISWARETSGS